MTYDAKCFALATSFMEDTTLTNRYARIQQMAQEIQTLIEDILDEYETEDRNAEGLQYKAEYDALHNRLECDDDPRSQAYAERVYEAADMERKRIREEGK